MKPLTHKARRRGCSGCWSLWRSPWSLPGRLRDRVTPSLLGTSGNSRAEHQRSAYRLAWSTLADRAWMTCDIFNAHSVICADPSGCSTTTATDRLPQLRSSGRRCTSIRHASQGPRSLGEEWLSGRRAMASAGEAAPATVVLSERDSRAAGSVGASPSFNGKFLDDHRKQVT